MGYLIQIGANIDLISKEFDNISKKDEITFTEFMTFMDRYEELSKKEKEENEN